MTISFTRYVDIRSSVGGASAVQTRRLTGRMFTTNSLVPTSTLVTFTSATEVKDYFGSSSEEYARAQFYFGWTSKNSNSARSLDFARWVDADSAPQIYGNKQPESLSTWNAITSGSIGLTIGGVSRNVTSLNFSGAASLSAVAQILQDGFNDAGSFILKGTTNGTTTVAMDDTTGLVAGMSVFAPDIDRGTTIVSIVPDTSIMLSAVATDSNVDEDITFNTPMFGLSSVTYNATRESFDFVGGVEITAVITVQQGIGGTPIGNQLGWLSGTSLLISNGQLAETPVDAVSNSAAANNNFGSFLFLEGLTTEEITDLAAWNDGQNVSYMYCVPVVNADATALFSAINTYSGTAVTLSEIANQYPEQIPMMIMAATAYTQVNSVQNYMFQVFPGIDPGVTSDTDADFYDNLRINYYGVTQNAGQLLAFYQRGSMMGLSTAPLAMNTYANEVWLKAAAGAAIMNMFLAQLEVPANAAGTALVLNVLQSVIDLATVNGTISANKVLNAEQKQFITDITDDPNAWQQVQTIGYWTGCEIVDVSPSEKVAKYTLVYSKDDVINKVEGSHDLI